eukprot:m51a1_g6588 hypothetical protein (399) ;mRNA; f:238015-242717
MPGAQDDTTVVLYMLRWQKDDLGCWVAQRHRQCEVLPDLLWSHLELGIEGHTLVEHRVDMTPGAGGAEPAGVETADEMSRADQAAQELPLRVWRAGLFGIDLLEVCEELPDLVWSHRELGIDGPALARQPVDMHYLVGRLYSCGLAHRDTRGVGGPAAPRPLRAPAIIHAGCYDPHHEQQQYDVLPHLDASDQLQHLVAIRQQQQQPRAPYRATSAPQQAVTARGPDRAERRVSEAPQCVWQGHQVPSDAKRPCTQRRRELDDNDDSVVRIVQRNAAAAPPTDDLSHVYGCLESQHCSQADQSAPTGEQHEAHTGQQQQQQEAVESEAPRLMPPNVRARMAEATLLACKELWAGLQGIDPFDIMLWGQSDVAAPELPCQQLQQRPAFTQGVLAVMSFK